MMVCCGKVGGGGGAANFNSMKLNKVQETKLYYGITGMDSSMH
jgi:hypothetical protein